MKKFLSLVLALAMVFSLAACGGNGDTPASNPPADNSQAPSQNAGEPAAFTPVTYDYEAIYNETLGEFYDIYMKAKEAVDVNERWALMAVAEAKLLETGAVSLTNCRGGNYAMSRVVNRTVTGVKFGNDFDRSHQAVVCNEFIRSEDQTALRALWNELAGTGTYLQAAKDYVTEKGYTIRDTYGYTYVTEPTTWDMFATSQQTDTEPVVQTYEGLMEYDCENVMQPAMATEMTMSEDGLTYTFKIREGQVWVDNQGRKVADVKADDWVAGMQHLLDAKGGLQSLLFGIIVNAQQYSNGEITDFAEVGVKALDDYTLEYTLEAPCAYFPTMLGYSLFAPLSREFYESRGGKFGVDYKPDDASYTYGKGPENIAYSGPYLCTSATDHNSIIYKANDSYWNPDNVSCKNLIWYFDDGSDSAKRFQDAMSGTTNGLSLTAEVLEMARNEMTDIPREDPQEGESEFLSYFDAYHYISATDATTFMGFYNLARMAFANFDDPSRMVSTQEHGSVDAIDLDAGVFTTDIEDTAARTHVAMNNQNFRLALTFALDRGAWNSVRYGEELKFSNLLNTIVPGDFSILQGDATIDINGNSHTFPAGTNYGEIVQAALTEFGINAKVWDEELASSSGFDGWFNVDEAKAYMDKAVEELAAQGVEVSAENPIEIDYCFASEVEVFNNQAHVLEQCMNDAFGGKVKVNLVGGSQDDTSSAAYQPTNGFDMNYDLSHQSGWGPDYGDPATWLDCFLPYGDGFMCKSLGLWEG